MIRLIVGLGNPGPAYEDTRHNAGFWWVDGAASRLRATLAADRHHHGLLARVNHPGPGLDGPVWLLEPLTFMNLSGKAVASLARFYKIAPHEILVVHDELDLLPGQLKLKQGGGVAGHNGLKDIRAQLGADDFWRLRLGIGHPGDRAEVANYVLRKPPAAERDLIVQAIDTSLQALDLLLAGAMDRAVMKLHAKPPRPKPPRRPADAPRDAPPDGRAAAAPDARPSEPEGGRGEPGTPA
ncbi:MAG: aminoacyl-tRNA hydrolase [Ideonella sp.]|jgi:PTH1 family peptidyl-tRNA hydrolase|nr:aminoacyl-tRNA hydrolase [Ideonella sp.]